MEIYFVLTRKTEKEFRGRYTMFDVETKVIVAGGDTYMPNLNFTWKKRKVLNTK